MSPLASSNLLTHLLIFLIHYSSKKAQNVTQGSITELVHALKVTGIGFKSCDYSLEVPSY